MTVSESRRSPGGAQKAPPAATATTASRDRAPVEMANEVVTRTLLRRVRFSEFSAYARMAIQEVDEETPLRASINFRRPNLDLLGDGKDAGFKATSTLVFRLDVPSLSSDDDSNGEPCVVVKATLEASYAFKDSSPDFSEEQLKTFALHYCPFHVWGYWREFVHSSLARLEFPTLTVPLFQIDMAEALVVDEVD